MMKPRAEDVARALGAEFHLLETARAACSCPGPVQRRRAQVAGCRNDGRCGERESRCRGSAHGAMAKLPRHGTSCRCAGAIGTRVAVPHAATGAVDDNAEAELACFMPALGQSTDLDAVPAALPASHGAEGDLCMIVVELRHREAACQHWSRRGMGLARATAASAWQRAAIRTSSLANRRSCTTEPCLRQPAWR